MIVMFVFIKHIYTLMICLEKLGSNGNKQKSKNERKRKVHRNLFICINYNNYF